MADMEKVIKGLQEAAAYFRSSFDAMYGTVACEKFRSWTDAIEQALALLKAQEARVMTLEELDELQEDDAVFVEIKPVRDLTCMSVELVRFIEKTQDPATQIELHTTDSAGFYMTRKTTDPNWRCWTSRPTDEQREATPWRS